MRTGRHKDKCHVKHSATFSHPDGLSRKEVAKRLKLSVASIRRLEGNVLFPIVDRNGVHRFDPADVDALASTPHRIRLWAQSNWLRRRIGAQQTRPDVSGRSRDKHAAPALAHTHPDSLANPHFAEALEDLVATAHRGRCKTPDDIIVSADALQDLIDTLLAN